MILNAEKHGENKVKIIILNGSKVFRDFRNTLGM